VVTDGKDLVAYGRRDPKQYLAWIHYSASYFEGGVTNELREVRNPGVELAVTFEPGPGMAHVTLGIDVVHPSVRSRMCVRGSPEWGSPVPRSDPRGITEHSFGKGVIGR
jgi:hypothetical protein